MGGLDTRHRLALGAVTLLLLGVSTFGLAFSTKRHRPGLLYVVLATYTVLVVIALWLSHGDGFIIAMPLVSTLALCLPPTFAIGTAALLAVQIALGETSTLGTVKLLFGMLSAFVFVIAFSFLAKREKLARVEIERLASGLEELGATRERNRIAREIHDSLGHFLTVANIQLEAARASPDGAPQRITRAQELVRDALSELRRSVSLLRETPERPLLETLSALTVDMKGLGTGVELSVTGEARALPGATAFILYRAAQEALTNVSRHARAKSVRMHLIYAAGSVALEVEDDGVGPGVGFQYGNGLSGLSERVQAVGGTLHVGPGSVRGLSLRVTVPT
jgi:signal transduction histidine kinase